MTVVERGRETTNARQQIEVIREFLSLAIAELENGLDAEQAFRDATELEKLVSSTSHAVAELRAWSVTRMHFEQGMRPADIADLLGLSTGRIWQMIRAGKKNAVVTTEIRRG